MKDAQLCEHVALGLCTAAADYVISCQPSVLERSGWPLSAGGKRFYCARHAMLRDNYTSPLRVLEPIEAA